MAIQKWFGCSLATYTLIPPNTALEVEILHHDFLHERRKGLFFCIAPEKRFHESREETSSIAFYFLRTAKDLDTDNDTSQPVGS